MKAEQAVARFDAAMKVALQNAKPEEHDVFRTLLLLTKTEEALRRQDLGLSSDALAAIIMGNAHLWDRQYTQEMEDPKKRAEFIRNHTEEVLIPVLTTAIGYASDVVDTAIVREKLYRYIAAVDITRFRTPDHRRFPRSLLDSGVITPIVSYQSQVVTEALKK